MGIQAQKVLDPKDGLQPGQRLMNDGLFGSWLLRYSNSMQNGDVVLSSTLQGDLEGDSLLVLLGADWTVDDNWSVSGQVIATRAAANSPLLFLDEDVRAGLTLTYSF